MYVVIDIETNGLNRFRDEITMIGVYVPSHNYMDIFYEGTSFLKFLYTLPRDVQFIFQNGKFDSLFCYTKYGISIPVHQDVMLLSYVIDMGEPKSLDYLAEIHLGVKSWDIPLEEKMKVTEESKAYLRKDLKYTWELFEYLYNSLTEIQHKLYTSLVIRSFNAYRKIEQNGIAIDLERLEETLKKYEQLRDKHDNVLKQYRNMNWNSSKQLGSLLYGELYMPVLERTEKGEPSTSASVLRRLSKMGFKIADSILEFKMYNNAINTFLSKWKELAVKGRIYPTFNIDTTRTGRTSCKDPNLQQVPRNVELRSLFTAKQGYVLVEADQSQVELRIAAHYCGDETMISVYNNGGD